IEAGEAVEDRGLAGAVRADDGRDLARPGGERDVVDRDESAEAHGQMADLEQWHAHRPASAGPPPAGASVAAGSRPGGVRRTVGSRWASSPRGRQIMMPTMAAPKTSIRY